MQNDPLLCPCRRLGLNELTLGLFAAAVLLYGAVLWSARSPNVEKTDFSLTYVGARIVHQGLGSRLYDIDFQKQVRNSLFAHPNPLFFEHPPFEALLLSPWAALPFQTAYLLWGFFNATVWLLMILLMRAYFPVPREDLGYTALWLLFAPLGVALFQGQPSLLLLAVYSLVFVFLRQGKEAFAGAILGVGLFRFQFVVPFALIFLFRKKWRFIGGFCVAGFVWSVLSLLTTGWRGLVGYVTFLLAIGNNPQNLSFGSAVDMPTIHGFLYAIIGHRISSTILTVLVIAVSTALLYWIARTWAFSRTSEDLMYAAAVTGSLLSGSHMFTHDLSPLMIALLILVANYRAFAQSAWRVLTLCTLVVFWIPPVYFVLVALHMLYLMCPALLLLAFSAACNAENLSQKASRMPLKVT